MIRNHDFGVVYAQFSQILTIMTVTDATEPYFPAPSTICSFRGCLWGKWSNTSLVVNEHTNKFELNGQLLQIRLCAWYISRYLCSTSRDNL